MNKKITKLIDKVDVVSFDVFDTLLFRPYVRPIDLFLHMEQHYGIPHFKNARVNAECAARQRHSNRLDITINDIYKEIDDKFKEFKQKEMDWESMVLRPNPEMKNIWDYAKQKNKKIVVASDMYLPTDFIAGVLRKNGFGNYDKLYVSGDINQTKRSGILFNTIIMDMVVSPNKILHIGDNKYSDYKRPKECGICAYLYPNTVNAFLEKNTRVHNFYKYYTQNIGASVLVAMAAIRNLQERLGNRITKNYWEELGYEYAGPVSYGYSRWIEEVAKNKGLDHLFFVARDGYTLQRVFETFDTNIKHSYVYAPRFLNLICRLDYRTDESHVAYAQQKTIIDYYSEQDESFKKLVQEKKLTKHTTCSFLNEYKHSILGLADKNLNIYKKYLEKFASKVNAIGVIDTITENFSAQLLISNAMGQKKSVHGLYWHTINKKQIIDSDSYSAYITTTHLPRPNYISHWNFMEFLLTSPEYPIEGITTDGLPIYKKNVSESERIIRGVYPYISDGAVRFANDIKALFGGANVDMPYEVVTHWINCFIAFPSKHDRKHMGCIKTSSNPNNDTYDVLFGSKISIWHIISHPLDSLKMAKMAKWRTPLQSIAVCVFDPIKIKMHGLKDIKIFLFPKLHRTLFMLDITLIRAHLSIKLGKRQ